MYQKIEFKNFPDDVKLFISTITNEQSKPFQTSLTELLASAEENELEEALLKHIVPMYQLLETLFKEDKINSQQYNQRRISLLKLFQLAEEVNIKHQ